MHGSSYLDDDVEVYDDEATDNGDLEDWFERNITAGECYDRRTTVGRVNVRLSEITERESDG